MLVTHGTSVKSDMTMLKTKAVDYTFTTDHTLEQKKKILRIPAEDL